MPTPKPRWVARAWDEQHDIFPVKMFMFTGEVINPWRCEHCATKRQKAQAFRGPLGEINPPGYDSIVCRKCGMYYL